MLKTIKNIIINSLRKLLPYLYNVCFCPHVCRWHCSTTKMWWKGLFRLNDALYDALYICARKLLYH